MTKDVLEHAITLSAVQDQISKQVEGLKYALSAAKDCVDDECGLIVHNQDDEKIMVDIPIREAIDLINRVIQKREKTIKDIEKKFSDL